jgi:hypothetical protein
MLVYWALGLQFFVCPSNIPVPVSDFGKKYSNGNGLSIFPTVPDRFQA